MNEEELNKELDLIIELIDTEMFFRNIEMQAKVRVDRLNRKVDEKIKNLRINDKD